MLRHVSPPPGTEARQPRAPRVDLVLRVEFESLGQLRADFLSNLGPGGMFVRTPVPFSVGQPLSLQLRLPGVIEPPVQVDAEVRWVSAKEPDYLRGVGVAFRQVPPELEKALGRLREAKDAPGEASGATAALRVALLVANPILQDIILGELERLSRGGTHHRPCPLALSTGSSLEEGTALAATREFDVVIADCDGLNANCDRLVSALRGAARPTLPIFIMQRHSGVQAPPPPDSNTVVLRKPVSMKALYASLLTYASSGKSPP